MLNEMAQAMRYFLQSTHLAPNMLKYKEEET